MADIVHGIPEKFRAQAVCLYDDAFGDKIAVAISSRPARLALLESSLNLGFAFAAIIDDRLVGLAGYKTHSGSLADGIRYRNLIQQLGWIRGTWAAMIFILYERPLKPRELLMEGIVVDAAFRSQGIGKQLLDELSAFAASEDYDSVRLDVIETNDRARAMYERNRFVPTHTEHFGYLRWLLGFGASTTLVRNIRSAKNTSLDQG